jgi:hypothetical protein
MPQPSLFIELSKQVANRNRACAVEERAQHLIGSILNFFKEIPSSGLGISNEEIEFLKNKISLAIKHENPEKFTKALRSLLEKKGANL